MPRAASRGGRTRLQVPGAPRFGPPQPAGESAPGATRSPARPWWPCQTRPGRLGHSPRRPESPLVTLRQVAPQLELGPLVPASGHRRAALFREPKTPNRSPRSKPAGLRHSRRSPSHLRLLYWACLPSRSARIIVIASKSAASGLAARAESRPACSMLRCKAQLHKSSSLLRLGIRG